MLFSHLCPRTSPPSDLLQSFCDVSLHDTLSGSASSLIVRFMLSRARVDGLQLAASTITTTCLSNTLYLSSNTTNHSCCSSALLLLVFYYNLFYLHCADARLSRYILLRLRMTFSLSTNSLSFHCFAPFLALSSLHFAAITSATPMQYCYGTPNARNSPARSLSLNCSLW